MSSHNLYYKTFKAFLSIKNERKKGKIYHKEDFKVSFKQIDE